jgi:glucose-1-phosphate cytidylyltransferase
VKSEVPVVILCGGMGTRLREETEYRPKPLVEVGGRPVLWHIMKIYGSQGYKRFVLCLGYKGEMIRQYFLNYRLMTRNFTLQLDADMEPVVDFQLQPISD